MLDIGWSELLVVAIVAIVVVGPKELPKLMRTFGFYAGKVRRTAADFQRQFNEAMAESEADEVRKNIEAIRSNMGTTADFASPIDKPLMTPTAEPAPTALGAPPTGQSQATRQPKHTQARGGAAKNSSAKTSTTKNSNTKASSANSTKAAKGKASARRSTKSKAKTAVTRKKTAVARKTKTSERSAPNAKGKRPAEPKT